MKKLIASVVFATFFSSALAYDCQYLHDEIQELKSELNSTYVDRYSQYSVDNYNRKIHRINQLANQFNAYCVNRPRQSRSLGLTPQDSESLMRSSTEAMEASNRAMDAANRELNSLLYPNLKEMNGVETSLVEHSEALAKFQRQQEILRQNALRNQIELERLKLERQRLELEKKKMKR